MPQLLILIDVIVICHCRVRRSWNRPEFAPGDHVWQQHVVVLSLLLAAYEFANTEADPDIGQGSQQTLWRFYYEKHVGSKQSVNKYKTYNYTDSYGLPCITLVAPMDYWLCVSVCVCVSVFSR